MSLLKSNLLSCRVAMLSVAVALPLPAAPVDFNKQIRPLFRQHCVACHGGVRQEAQLSLLRRQSASSVFTAGDPEASLLLQRVTDPDDELRMPPAEQGRRLKGEEVALLREWIAAGGNWQQHWSLTPPRPASSPVPDEGWCRQPLDHFIHRRLTAEDLTPSPEASRQAWLRRVTFDLIGLPPTPREISDFVADRTDGAHARVVDRLLASPHLGERWATMWLDLARYADTMGYEKDPHRDIWPYRDWVIRAFNADMPFDQFTIKQLAGDLLPDATTDDRLATAFHRNTQNNTEGGADDEEFRIAAVIDRVNTTWQVWQGVTLACAQCHDHPYDEFTQRDYYRFLAFFNSTRDSDLVNEAPTLATPNSPQDYELAGTLDAEIRRLRLEHFDFFAKVSNEPDQWRPLAFDKLQSTGQTTLRFDAQTGELHAEGTITDKSKYTLHALPPEIDGPVTAVRIDALPKNPQAAVRTPELGFALTSFRLFVETAEEPAGVELFFAEAIGDEPLPTDDPNETLRSSNRGWSVFSRLSMPRHAVFILDEPLALPEGARLRIEWKHERALDGQGAMVIRRARVSLSTDSRWQQLSSSPVAVSRLDRLAELAAERKQIKSVRVPVLVERATDFTRRTFVFDRGSWLVKSDQVQPGVPESMPPLSANNPTRLALAKWLVSDQNPLTSRVMVNRVWAEMFGAGLVDTLDDLGASGGTPSHPELLDDLAVRFRTTYAWRLKRLLREMALSATYRQQARVTAELAARDPDNQLLARGPRRRLSAEMIRDQALVLSGKLNSTLFGKPVMPPQPAGVWRSPMSRARWVNSQGADRYRRAIYTYWKRTSGYPSLLAFDAPSREVCTASRVVTNTPLQALVTMNDPAVVDLAQGLADRMPRQAGSQPRKQIEWAYQAAAGRTASDKVVDELLSVYAEAVSRWADDPQACQPLADSADRFARVVVANVLLNLDEVLSR